MNANLILVNEQDQQIGSDTVINCHLADAKRHRAVTAFLRNSQGQYLIAKRSLKKPLWPTFWDAAFSTHPRVGETVVDCCVRRSIEELGIPSNGYKDLFNYEYHIRWNIVFSEWEINHILIATLKDPVQPTNLNPDEVSEIAWLTWDELTHWVASQPDNIAPWLIIAIKQIQTTPQLLNHFK